MKNSEKTPHGTASPPPPTLGRSPVQKYIIYTLSSLFIIYVIFYFVWWRVPDHGQTAREVLQNQITIQQELKKLPPEKNAWLPYQNLTEIFNWKMLKDEQERWEKGIISNEDAELLKSVEENLGDNKLELVKTLELPDFYFFMDFEKGLIAPIPDISSVKALAKSLTALGSLKEIEKDYQGAVLYHLNVIRLGSGIQNMGNLFFSLEGLTIEQPGISYLNRLLSMDDIPREIYSDVKSRLLMINGGRKSFSDVLAPEVLFVHYSFENARKNQKGVFPDTLDTGDGASFPKKQILVRDEKIYLNWFSGIYNTVKEEKDLKTVFQEFRKTYKEVPKNTYFVHKYMPEIFTQYARYRFNTALIRGMILLCALKEYKIDKGDYPDALEQLIPRYLEELPRDPFSEDGKYIYTKENGKMELFSLGIPRDLPFPTVEFKIGRGFVFKEPEKDSQPSLLTGKLPIFSTEKIRK